jgi:hypothetical protein
MRISHVPRGHPWSHEIVYWLTGDSDAGIIEQLIVLSR